MAENKIELKSVSELIGMKFFIPSYQRGYRWTEQQVKDLLNDVNEFIQNKNSDFYSLQPLVVKKKWPSEDESITEEEKQKINSDLDKIQKSESLESAASIIQEISNDCPWEVIDGQQRLTTIYIILYYLDSISPYDIYYQTRKELKISDFLKTIKNQNFASDDISKDFNILINEDKCYDNIDFYHIFTSFSTIKYWFEFENKEKVKKDDFKDQLLKNVKFIWYESVDEDPIKVFTRLNIGKIKLTNSELIKALMLNRSNFKDESSRHIQLRQQEIASEWDNIEYTLQNDEFWLFLHENNYGKPTRIDFIFDLICKKNPFNLEKKHIGSDDYKTFRYFYEYFHSKDTSTEEELIKKCWEEVKKYFQTFQEWFNDLSLYHYVGYFMCFVNKENEDKAIGSFVEKWRSGIKEDKSGKDVFGDFLKDEIKNQIKSCKNLNQQYEIDDSLAKTKSKPLLLLHNIQTVINQNKELESKKEYGLPVFYKFPFHLYKKEKWDVEHIDSNTTNELEKEKDQKEWLKYTLLDSKVSENYMLKNAIKTFLNSKNSSKEDFESLFEIIEKCISSEGGWENPEKDKNKVWNFVLLDAGTNRGYGNAIFPAKRRCIIGKDQGKRIVIDDNLNESEIKGEIAFVPPVTKNVFLKYYNTSVDNLRCWNKTDADAYKQNILKTLAEFGVTHN